MQKKWWHDKVAYQIYPKSFMDTNGDGIGDLRGVISKLDYLKWLGIDVIWLSPVYQSPFVDQGYDISDYYKISEVFGTMEDFDELLAETKRRNMYLVMDLVINHCSDQHQWFQNALADPYGEYADYFYFRKGKNGGPPNNLRSNFGGSAWEPVPGTDLYYLHLFAKEQPDLNWTNPTVVQELYTMVNWWLEKGISGFRIDAIINIKKDTDFPDYPADGEDGLASAAQMLRSVNGVGTYLEDLKHQTFEKYDAFTVGEVFDMKPDELAEFIGENGHFSTMFDFSQHVLTYGKHGWYDAEPVTVEQWKKAVFQAHREADPIGFYSTIIENHDEPRGCSTYLPKYAQNSLGAKLLGTVSILRRGLPFLYQGQEIGMTNCQRNSIEEYDDISTRDQYSLALSQGLSPEDALARCARYSRDNARTPMQWNGGSNAGFTTATPWLAPNPNYPQLNLDVQMEDPDSVLHYYQKLVALRKSPDYCKTFVYGSFQPVFEKEKDVIAYLRQDEKQCILVAANLRKDAVSLELPSETAQVLLSNLPASDSGKIICLQSCQAVVLKLK